MIPKDCKRLAEDWRDCCWLYVLADCDNTPWHDVSKVAHHYLSVDAMVWPMRVRQDSPPYGEKQ
ncbi:MAG: hypothetical protein M3R31_07235 [Pseudomonadota bacterium]|nr:hypothetical protein [Pseudomonadota bacterium]